jgi:hypothetical protein
MAPFLPFSCARLSSSHHQWAFRYRMTGDITRYFAPTTEPLLNIHAAFSEEKLSDRGQA